MAWKYQTLLPVVFLSICSIYSICSICCLKHSPMLSSESLVWTFPRWWPLHQQSFLWWQPSQGRTGLMLLPIDPHFHDLWISISWLQVIPCGTECLSPCCCCGCIVWYIIMGNHLSTAWIKNKDRNRIFYAEWEQSPKNSTWNNWITFKRKFPREVNGEIDLLWCLQLLNTEQNIIFASRK